MGVVVMAPSVGYGFGAILAASAIKSNVRVAPEGQILGPEDETFAERKRS